MTTNDLIREIMTECGWRPEIIDLSLEKLGVPDTEIAPDDVEPFRNDLRKTAQHFLENIVKTVKDQKVSNN